MNINGYELKAELKNANSGFSKWGFAKKSGKEYFIKELINPVYPIDKSIMSEELFDKRRTFCSQYEIKFKNFFERINEASRGNLVRINEFFRSGSRYYLVTEKVGGKSVSIETISSLEYDKKILLLKTVAHCFNDLHSAGIVHFDVKPSNILIKVTKSGNYVAKLIDFDSGFIKGETFDNKELGGDLTYLAPETFLGIYGEDIKPDEKADIFGLGLVFHEYYCGKLPYYDESEYEYPYEAALDNGVLMPDLAMLPEEIGKLIISMLDCDPKKRPSADEIIKLLNVLSGQECVTKPIKQMMVHYDGDYGKTISISSEAIRYKNTMPSPACEEIKENDCYPPDFLIQKKRPITNIDTYEKILGKIVDAGLWDLISINESNYDNMPYTITCLCEDGTVFSYFADSAPDTKFTCIVDILSKYCTFPCVLESSPPDSKEKNKDWFKPAGDL